MTNEMNQPKNNDELSPFEKRLRDQSLGSRPVHRGEILYECGYAAGVIASQKKTRVATTRWQIVSLAASAIACLSFSAHFVPAELNRSMELGKENSGNVAQQQSTEVQPAATTDAWITHLTRDRHSDQQTAGTLRPSGTPKGSMNTGGLVDKMEYMPFTTSNPPLRPSDFPRFL